MRPLVSAIFCIALLFVSCLHARGVPANKIKNLVTFGDSYTDVVLVSNGGTPWPVYAAGYAHISLFPFARAGATCSNNITFRPFPSVFESQLPLYFTEKGNGSLKLVPSETIYTLWIGTNDVGISALLTGDDNASIVDVAACMVNWVEVLYKSGARNFLFQNMIPLQHVPLYAPDSYPDKYWSLPRNTTEWSVFMAELVQSGNMLAQLMLQALVPTLHGAHVGKSAVVESSIFNSYGLFQDMFNHPSAYLNGTAPLNVTGAVQACVFPLGGGISECTNATGTAVDSFLWFNELHPSEQADRVVAKNIAEAIQGKENKWTTWLS